MKGFSLIVCFLFLSASLWSQSIERRKCAAQIIHNEKLENDPIYKSRYEEIERRTKDFQTQRQFSRVGANALTREIPVYVHIIYDENVPEQNISDAQVESQIAVLNEDFRALNADISQVPTEFESLVSDYNLTFTLEAITRKSSAVSSWDTDNTMKSVFTGGVNPITPETHLNIWVCNLTGTILGYAQFPGGTMTTDGVVVGTEYFGSTDYDTNNDFLLTSPYTKGRTATHEVGHYLNLFHIWGDGGCSVDDEVGDTPIAAEPNYGCPSPSVPSCPDQNTTYTTDMYMNYMDYVDDACMFMFTEGQKVRSQALFESGGFRENLGEIDDGCDLVAPSNVSITNSSSTTLSLTWDPVTNANGYDIWVDGTISSSATNSMEVSGLQGGTVYEVKVAAKCSGGGKGTYSEMYSFSTLGCYQGPLELTINTDQNGAEVAWELSLNGTIINSFSGTYDNNTTYTQTFNYGEGNYEFTIYDAGSNGLCCASGEGSYSLVDNSGRTIVAGSDYGVSESAKFCLDTSESVDCTNSTIAEEGVNTTVSTPVVFEFTASEDREYIISSIGNTSVNTLVQVYSDCNILLGENDDFNSSTQSEIAVVLEANQKIQIYWKDTYSTSGFDWSISPGRLSQAITFDQIAEKKVDDEAFELSATASSGLELVYTSSDPAVATISGSTVSITGAGETTLTATQTGDDAYLAAPPAQNKLVVSKLDQTITIEEIGDKYFKAEDFTVEASASTGLDLTYAVTGPASISGNIVSLEGSIGTVEVTATQAGNSIYAKATATTTFEVLEDPCTGFGVSELNIQEVSCSGGQDGEVEVELTAGTAPFSYRLNGAEAVDSNVFSNLSAGEYTIAIKDANGCEAGASIRLTNPEEIIIMANVANSNSIYGNGSIDLTVSGGTGAYTYSWNTGDTTSLLENLEVGTYTVMVSDSNVCTLEESFTVGGVTSNENVQDQILRIYPNPAGNILQISYVGNSNVLFIYNAMGKLVEERGIDSESMALKIDHLAAGIYFLRVPNLGAIQKFLKK